MSPSPCCRFRTIWFKIRWFHYREIIEIRNIFTHYFLSISVIGGEQVPMKKSTPVTICSHVDAMLYGVYQVRRAHAQSTPNRLHIQKL